MTHCPTFSSSQSLYLFQNQRFLKTGVKQTFSYQQKLRTRAAGRPAWRERESSPGGRAQEWQVREQTLPATRRSLSPWFPEDITVTWKS